MPRADELFDEILFPELNREDSQKYLDEMKHELRSPLKPTDVSPYSREGSVRSFSRCGPPNMISTGAPRSPNFHAPFPRPDPNFPCPQQARSYSGPELYERSGPPPGGYSPGFSTSSHSFPRDHPYGTNSRYGSSLARDDSYGGYRGSDTNNASRFRSPMGSLSYDGRTGPSGDFRLPHEPPVRLQSPSLMSAGPPPIHLYGDLPYGSPYGTPPPKRPYEDFSPGDSYSGLVHGTPPPTHPYGGRPSGSPYGVQPYGGVRPAGSFAGSSPYEAPPPRQPYGNGGLPPPVGRYSGPYSSYTPPGSSF